MEFPRILIAYIVAPYRAETIHEIRRNIQAAERLAEIATTYDFFPYCPHKNTAFFDGLKDDSFWLEGNIEMIKRVQPDAAVVRWNYFMSEGSIEEVDLMHKLGIPRIIEPFHKGDVGVANGLRALRETLYE